MAKEIPEEDCNTEEKVNNNVDTRDSNIPTHDEPTKDVPVLFLKLTFLPTHPIFTYKYFRLIKGK